jgi:hypothetical protein
MFYQVIAHEKMTETTAPSLQIRSPRSSLRRRMVKQSGIVYAPGLPRRYAPRNDGVVTRESTVCIITSPCGFADEGRRVRAGFRRFILFSSRLALSLPRFLYVIY